MRNFPLRVLAARVRRPTLDDVFLTLTGHSIRDDSANNNEKLRRFVSTPGMKAQIH
jgi:hypothetical protein